MYAALDISQNKIGIAISTWNRDGVLWSDTIKNKISLLKNVYLKYKPQFTIIGLPTHADGNLTANGIFVKDFVEKTDFLRPYEYVDEYLSTQEAKNIIESKNLRTEIDSLVAKIMIYKYSKIESALLNYGLYY
jgi:RNase H-fold protein (predicted Holliday junction resolvase)